MLQDTEMRYSVIIPSRVNPHSQQYYRNSKWQQVSQMPNLVSQSEQVRQPQATILAFHYSSRMLMVESLLRSWGRKRYEWFSAWTQPRAVHPLAIEAMVQIGID